MNGTNTAKKIQQLSIYLYRKRIGNIFPLFQFLVAAIIQQKTQAIQDVKYICKILINS